MGAYEIFENTLNQRSVQIYDYKENAEGKEIRVLNEKQTAIAQQKQEAIKEAFQNWIFKEPERRSDLCRKSMFVVPNHLTEQWGSEFLVLYPGAKVLVATRKDFEPKNRKRFCARTATDDFDAVVIGHSQFEKIPLSRERQEALIQAQIQKL